MKKLFLCCAMAALVACSSQPQTGYVVNVNVSGDLAKLNNDTLVLANFSKSEPIEQAAVLVNGKCSFSGELLTPEVYGVKFKGSKGSFTRFFVENGCVYSVSFSAEDPSLATVDVGITRKVIEDFNKQQQKLYEKYNADSLAEAYKLASSEQKDEIDNIFNNIHKEYEALKDKYIAENLTSNFALSELATRVESISIDSAIAKIERFKALPEFENNRIVKETDATIGKLSVLQPGNIAPDFTQNDPKGNAVTFSDIYSKNKVTMIDFWASWCAPCRAFNPKLVEIYKKYHKKGFEILGVSFDKEQQKWEDAIKNDNLSWYHVSDLGGWENVVGYSYYVRYIPQNIFVDNKGKILGRQVAEEDIEKLLQENL